MQKFTILYVCCFLFIFQPVKAQEQSKEQLRNEFDKKYGMDISLNEGMMYFPELNIVAGNPFWESDKVFPGTIVLNGSAYPNQFLKYDIFNQNFILVFHEHTGVLKQIILDPYRVDSVFIGNAVFIKNPFPEIDKRYIQMIFKGDVSCYVSWWKQKVVRSNTDKAGYSFLKQENNKYIVYHSKLFEFEGVHQFCKIFPKIYSKEIKHFLKINEIQLRKADTFQLQKLMKFVKELIEE